MGRPTHAELVRGGPAWVDKDSGGVSRRHVSRWLTKTQTPSSSSSSSSLPPADGEPESRIVQCESNSSGVASKKAKADEDAARLLVGWLVG